MTFPNNDAVTCELSIKELDAVAAGGWLSTIENDLKGFFTNPVVAGVAGAIILGGGIITAGDPVHHLN
jgi:hypothetical protein